MMGTLVEYWYNTGDDSYVNLTMSALLSQTGEHDDFVPKAQNLNEGNDDQGFWGLAVMSATEYNFPNPPPDKPQWLALAQAVFNTQAARWDTSSCNGGLRWQIFEWNNGFDYKNSISQACFFALAGRLALYTSNSSYADWATKAWDWMVGVKLIDENYYVFDGGHIEDNCTSLTPYQWTYNAGGFVVGAAAMYNFTESEVWKDRLDGLLRGTRVFFPKDNIMAEVACESVHLCDLDAQSFKAYLSRWMAAITKWAPHTYEFVMPYLRASAVAAGAQCLGGDNGRMCGMVWNNDGEWDGSTGVGQQMAAMEVTLACMIKDRLPSLTSHTGGTSQGKPDAGGSHRFLGAPKSYPVIDAGSRTGAAILTILIVTGLVGATFWLILDERSDETIIQQFKGLRGKASAAAAAAVAVGGGTGPTKQRRIYQARNHDRKGNGVATNISVVERSSQSSPDQVTRRDSFVLGQLHHASSASLCRSSVMPLGWPHNPALRKNSETSQGLRRPNCDPKMSRSASSEHADSDRRYSEPLRQVAQAVIYNGESGGSREESAPGVRRNELPNRPQSLCAEKKE